MTYLPYWPKKIDLRSPCTSDPPDPSKILRSIEQKHKGQKSYSVVIFFKSKLKVRDEYECTGI